jgi:mutual gliding-motility protein MglA
MPVVQHALKELHLKLVYYGPGLGGKTTNLEWIHQNSRPEYRGKLLSLTTETERTLFFDLLPVDLGTYREYTVRLHLCTVPGQIRYDQTRRLVLRHADGIVFVVDSQHAALDANIESVRNLEVNLMKQGDDPTRMPLIVQYNKRDLSNVMATEELRDVLRVPHGVTEVEASARYGRGVFDTLRSITKACLTLVGDPHSVPEGRSPSILPGRRASMFPGGLPPAVANMRPGGVLASPLMPRIGYGKG